MREWGKAKADVVAETAMTSSPLFSPTLAVPSLYFQSPINFNKH
jgi:hypothetical protein